MRLNSRRNFILALIVVFIGLFTGFIGSDNRQVNATVIPSSTIIRHRLTGLEPVKLPIKSYKQFKRISGFNFVKRRHRKPGLKLRLGILWIIANLIILGILGISCVIGGNKYYDKQKNIRHS